MWHVTRGGAWTFSKHLISLWRGAQSGCYCLDNTEEFLKPHRIFFEIKNKENFCSLLNICDGTYKKYTISFFCDFVLFSFFYVLRYFPKIIRLNAKKDLKRETQCNFLLKRETFQIKRDLKETFDNQKKRRAIKILLVSCPITFE